MGHTSLQPRLQVGHGGARLLRRHVPSGHPALPRRRSVLHYSASMMLYYPYFYAAATDDSRVRLIDLKTLAYTHTLVRCLPCGGCLLSK